MKNKFKEIILGSLGTVGYVIWILLGFAIMFVPLWFLEFSSFWIYLILTAILMIPYIGGMLNFGLYILSFLEVLSQPIDGCSIFYFVVFAIYVLTQVLPTVVDIVIIIASSFTNKDS